MIVPSRGIGPQFQQLPLPGIGDDRGPEQMRLFDTHRAGPAAIYAKNPSFDAANWQDRDKYVPRTAEEEAIYSGEDENPMERGEFYDFESEPFSSEREFVANQDAYGRSRQQFEEAGTHLGHDAYPERVNPDLKFDDLVIDEGGYGYGETTWSTREGTPVGKVTYNEDEWGPYVETAEVSPMYRGRGFSRDAITDFASTAEGIVHAGSYTEAGAGAFHAKGIPTAHDLRDGFEQWIGDREPDDDVIMERARDLFPDKDWEGASAAEAGERGTLLRQLRSRAELDMLDDEDLREEYKDTLGDIQGHMVGKIEASRRGEFYGGWKPKQSWGWQEKMEL